MFICVLAYALWKTLDHLAKRAGLMTEIRKPDRTARGPKPRPMTPEVILRTLGQIMIGDIELATTDGRGCSSAAWSAPTPSRSASWMPRASNCLIA